MPHPGTDRNTGENTTRPAISGSSRSPAILALALVCGLMGTGTRAIAARGAAVPWISYEAEDGTVKGGAVVKGPGRKLGTVEGEASGREAVVLSATGASVEWVAIASANSIVVRNSIPDAPNGGGMEATLSLYINGQKKASLKLSSVHSWIYGGYDTQTDDPKNGPARKVYDETQLLFNGFSIAKGDVVQLKKDAEDGAASYAIDFIDLEQVAPALPMPAGYISITEGGHGWAAAVPNDGNPDDEAINKCIAAAQSGQFAGVYIPAGTFNQVNRYAAKNVKIQGAGMWYSKIYCGNRDADGGRGKTGFDVTGNGAEFRDFAVFGWGGTRTQGGKAFAGSAYKGTILERIWVESVQCAYWVGGNDESTGLLIKDCRFRNTGADGVNLCNGNVDALIVNCHARNTGDDAFAIWSATDLYKHACVNNTIRDCTVQITWRAACFAIYGGTDNKILNCLGSDALTYPGLTISSDFNPYPLTSATVDGLTLYRCGNIYWDDNQQFGAIWVFAADHDVSNVTIKNADLVEPTFQGIHLQSQGAGAMVNVVFDNVKITDPTTFGIEIKAGTNGTATFRGVIMTGTANVPMMTNETAGAFKALTEKGSGIRAIQPALRAKLDGNGYGGPRSMLRFTVPGSANAGLRRVRISLNRADGRMVLLLVDALFAPGEYSLPLDRESLGLEGTHPGSALLAMELDGGKAVLLRQ
jgi:hypothetical protein